MLVCSWDRKGYGYIEEIWFEKWGDGFKVSNIKNRNMYLKERRII